MILKLTKPIQVGETAPAVVELHFRGEVVAGDLRGIKQSALADPLIDDILKIAGRLTGQPDVVMNRLCAEDLGEVLGIVHGFFKTGRKTGTEP